MPQPDGRCREHMDGGSHVVIGLQRYDASPAGFLRGITGMANDRPGTAGDRIDFEFG